MTNVCVCVGIGAWGLCRNMGVCVLVCVFTVGMCVVVVVVVE